MVRSFGMLLAVVVVAIHGIVWLRFSAAARRVREAARAHGLPDWLPAQVARVRGRASRFILGGAVAAVVAALVGLGTESPWSVAAASFAVGFNAVAFLVEYAGLVALRRLLAEVQARAGRPAEAPSPPPHDPEPMSI